MGRAAARGDGARERAQPRAVGARRAVAAAGHGRPRRRGAGAQHGQHGAAVGALSPRGDRARPDLRPLPRGACGAARQGDAPAGAVRRAPLGSRDRDLPAHAQRPDRAARRERGAHRCGAQRTGRRATRVAARGERRARPLRAGCACRPTEPLGEAAAQEPARADRRARADRARGSPRPRDPRLSHRARGGAARACGRARHRRRRALSRLAVERGAGGPVVDRAGVRVPFAVRGLRPAGARGDGARRARGLLGRLLAARGRRRRGAPVRPARSRGDRRCAAAPAQRSCARRDPARPWIGARTGVHLERTARLTLDSYARAMQRPRLS